jgi:hypothetical protein
MASDYPSRAIRAIWMRRLNAGCGILSGSFPIDDQGQKLNDPGKVKKSIKGLVDG